MMASSTTKSNGTSIMRKKFQRSVSAPGKFCSSTISSSSSSFASSISSFSSPTRSSTPNRSSESRSGPPSISINRGCAAASTSVRFPINQRNASPDRSVASSSAGERNQSGNHGNINKACINGQKKTCMCSPATHPGSLRCSLQKNVSDRNSNNNDWHRLYVRRKAMTNSIVRIGTVKGDLVKRALASLIRPSLHRQRRRFDFQPRPSRLSVMSKEGD